MEQRIPIRKLRMFTIAPLSLGKFRLAEYCSPNGVRDDEFCVDGRWVFGNASIYRRGTCLWPGYGCSPFLGFYLALA
jgi:hypothetical protein